MVPLFTKLDVDYNRERNQRHKLPDANLVTGMQLVGLHLRNRHGDDPCSLKRKITRQGKRWKMLCSAMELNDTKVFFRHYVI